MNALTLPTIAASVLAGICAPPASGQALVLTDVTTAMGINWVQSGDHMGAGAAFLDYDGDGWLDILLVGGGNAPTLYRNLQGTSFTPVPQATFPANPGIQFMCATVADIDNDGDPDVFLGCRGLNALYRNDGNGNFTDITTDQVAGDNEDFTTTAAFADYDGDGNLDLYVGNYILFPAGAPQANVMLRGNGDGTFVDVTTATTAGAGTTLASAWTDVDEDGDPDLLIGNDFGALVEPNQFYRNDGPGAPDWTFHNASAAAGFDIPIYCMGIAVGDVDRDGDLDYYFTNLGRNALLRNDGAAGCVDITTATGTGVEFDLQNPGHLATSWGAGFHDFDNDGWLDLYVSNGFVPFSIPNGNATANTLFHHDGAALTFTEIDANLDEGIGRGAAFGDFDNDGDVDVLQANIGQAGDAMRLLRNDSPNGGHWLQVDLRGRLSNRDALGARIDVDVGEFVACREVRRNDSFESSSERRANFGLGTHSFARELHVRWPSGVEQQLHGLTADRSLRLSEPLVTARDARIDVIPTVFGDILIFRAELENHTASSVDAVYAEQLRFGIDAPPGLGAATLWSGALRTSSIGAHGVRSVFAVHILPTGTTLPAVPLDHVWVVADAGLGVDEARIRVTMPE